MSVRQPAKKRLAIIATGGTIAMASGSDQAGATLQLDGHGLARGLQLPEVTVEVMQPFSKASASIDLADLRALVTAVAQASTAFDGVVITHGTDTLEETAWALQLLRPGPAPVVLTGAMRRSDEPGADGPANLIAAARTALSPAARDLGVLVVFGDEIHSASFVRKAHAFRTHAFSSSPLGPVGWVSEGRACLIMRPVFMPSPVSLGPRDPRVPLLEISGGSEEPWLDAAQASAEGLVLNLPGGGHAPEQAVERIARLAASMPVVFATRTGAGETLRESYGYAGGEIDLISRGAIGAGLLDGRKARIALRLLLSGGADIARVRAWFEGLGR